MSVSKNKDEIPTRGQDGGQSETSDKVGDVLRKERLTRRITIETIAKDLKLNAGYLKALEASDYSSLPADPYIRVYIKSLTKYLSLDTEVIMKQFYKEQGVIEDDKAANKIVISVQKQEKNPTIVVAVALILIFVIFAFIANQRGWLVQPDAVVSETTAVIENAEEADDDLGIASEDSTIAAINAPHDSTAAAKAPPRP
ncbi:MAG: helix-turn-helix domain-containing protein [Chitinispirillales bacterium]|jgi:cytoskeletal protein RodZ|nr:helix-turn-helix domain-containing protein [Chitinispirillales bacterium]